VDGLQERRCMDGCFATAYAVVRLTSLALAGESGDSHYLQGTCAGRSRVGCSGLDAT
jgi:hypothetical protein